MTDFVQDVVVEVDGPDQVRVVTVGVPGQTSVAATFSAPVNTTSTSLEQIDVQELGIVGPQGPQGLPGSDGAPGTGGTPAFIFDQPTASAFWHIVHGVGIDPSVVVRRDDGVTVAGFGSVYSLDRNTVDLYFGQPISGIATLTF